MKRGRNGLNLKQRSQLVMEAIVLFRVSTASDIGYMLDIDPSYICRIVRGFLSEVNTYNYTNGKGFGTTYNIFYVGDLTKEKFELIEKRYKVEKKAG